MKVWEFTIQPYAERGRVITIQPYDHPERGRVIDVSAISLADAFKVAKARGRPVRFRYATEYSAVRAGWWVANPGWSAVIHSLVLPKEVQ